MKFEPASFWNKKILRWENDKYHSNRMRFSTFDVNSSLKFRMRLARAILKRVVQGRTVIELGCGSALLAEDIIAFGATKYVGIDISSTGIAAAKARLASFPDLQKIDLLVADVSGISALKSDICFSLGLFDWLKNDDIKLIRQKIETQYFFHTFSEKNIFSTSQIFHKIYVYLLYGYKNRHYLPKYHTALEIIQLLESASDNTIRVYRRKELSFGCVAYSLPIEIENLS